MSMMTITAEEMTRALEEWQHYGRRLLEVDPVFFATVLQRVGLTVETKEIARRRLDELQALATKP